jgi:hypothetical protein
MAPSCQCQSSASGCREIPVDPEKTETKREMDGRVDVVVGNERPGRFYGQIHCCGSGSRNFGPDSLI